MSPAAERLYAAAKKTRSGLRPSPNHDPVFFGHIHLWVLSSAVGFTIALKHFHDTCIRCPRLQGAPIATLLTPPFGPRLIDTINRNIERRGGPDTLLMTTAPEHTVVRKALAARATRRRRKQQFR